MKLKSKIIASILTVTLLSSCNEKNISPNLENDTATLNTSDLGTTNIPNDTDEDSSSVFTAQEVVDNILSTQSLKCEDETAGSLIAKSITSTYSYSTIYPDGVSEISKTFSLKVTFHNRNNKKLALVSLLEEGKFRQLLLDENRNIILTSPWTNPSRLETQFFGEYEIDEANPSSITLSLLGSKFLKFQFKNNETIEHSTVTYFPNSFALPLELRNANPQSISLLETQTVFQGGKFNEELCGIRTEDTDFNRSSFEDFFNMFIRDNELICDTENRTASGFSFIDSSYPVSVSRNGRTRIDSYRDIYIFNLDDSLGNKVTRLREITACKDGDSRRDDGNTHGCNLEKIVTVSEGTFTQSSKDNTIEISLDNEKVDFTFRKMSQNEIAVIIENSSKYNNIGWLYNGTGLKIKTFVENLCHNNL